jgi:hypothetical protein
MSFSLFLIKKFTLFIRIYTYLILDFLKKNFDFRWNFHLQLFFQWIWVLFGKIQHPYQIVSFEIFNTRKFFPW